MKNLCVLSLLLLSTVAGSDNRKISHIEGAIDAGTAQRYFEETTNSLQIPGPRTIYINSLGGELDAGQNIIDMIEAERAHGVKIVCAVTEEATSMAFNILTHCDRRYASRTARFLVHKAAMGGWYPWLRMTARNLRLVANDLQRSDEVYRQANSKAMHLSLDDYDENADLEKTWSAKELVKLGYLNGYTRN